MTAFTCVRRVVVIAVVARRTVVRDNGMSAIEHIIVIVVRKRSRVPTRISCMTGGAICRKCQVNVIRVGGLVIVVNVTTVASVWCVVVISIVTSRTIVRNNGMSAIEHIIVIVVCKRSRIPTGVGCVARFTICRKCQVYVIWIGGLIVIGLVAASTSIRRVVVIAVVTSVAIIGNFYVCSGERIERTVVEIRR